jgi:hypothetical protein
MTVSNGFSFQWINNPETKELFSWLNSTIQLPDRRTLGGRILNEEANELKKDLEMIAKKDKLGVSVIFDGWTNVRKQKILGTILVTSSGRNLIWKAEDISTERSRWTDIYSHVENIMDEFAEQGIKMNCLVTDSAGEYTAARYVISFFNKLLKKNDNKHIFIYI